VRVQLDTDKVRALFAEAGGDVVRFMLQQGERVKIRAQELVGVYVPPPAGPERTRAPGTLRDSIVKRFHVTEAGVVVEVGSADPIALIHHEGTEPHTITATRAPMLVFWSERAGAVIAVKSVQHPGTRPNRFLTEALEVLG
jgi:hypothetical protein